VETSDLPELKQLADRLARIDAHFARAAAGGGTPDPNGTTLNQALLGLRSETAALHGHVASVLAAVSGVPIFEQIQPMRPSRASRALSAPSPACPTSATPRRRG
jgi:hypothetical protein